MKAVHYFKGLFVTGDPMNETRAHAHSHTHAHALEGEPYDHCITFIKGASRWAHWRQQ